MVYVAVSFCTPSGHAHFIVSLNINDSELNLAHSVAKVLWHIHFWVAGRSAYNPACMQHTQQQQRTLSPWAQPSAPCFVFQLVGAAELALYVFSGQSRARHVFGFLGAAERAAVSCRGAAERANLSASAKHSEVQIF